MLSRYFLSLTVLVLTAVSASAQCVLTLQPQKVRRGQTTELVVGMTNDSTVLGLQFNLSLPEGVELLCSKADASERAPRHGLTVKRMADGQYLFLLYSMTNAELAPSSGTLLRVPLRATRKARRCRRFPLQLTDIVACSHNGHNLQTEVVAGRLRVR